MQRKVAGPAIDRRGGGSAPLTEGPAVRRCRPLPAAGLEVAKPREIGRPSRPISRPLGLADASGVDG